MYSTFSPEVWRDVQCRARCLLRNLGPWRAAVYLRKRGVPFEITYQTLFHKLPPTL